MRRNSVGPAAGLLLAAWAASTVSAGQLVVSSNDRKQALINGVVTQIVNPPPDTATIIDFDVAPPRVLAEIPAPGGVTGPPQAVAITPDRRLALIASSTRPDPATAGRSVPNDVVSVVDLQANPPSVIATLHVGGRAGGVSINKAGTLALVGTRSDGGVAVLTIAGTTVTQIAKVAICDNDCDPSTTAFTPDGRTALVTRFNDHKVSVLAIDGTRVTYTKEDISSGPKPYPMEMAPDGRIAVVSNVGNGLTGGADTLSVIDLTGTFPRVVNSVSVPPLPEGIAFSHDGQFLAAASMNGSNSPPTSRLFNDFGLLTVFRRAGTALTQVAQTRIGHWCEGIAWNAKGDTLLVQCAEEELQVFRFNGRRLTRTGGLKVHGVPSGIGTAR